MVHDINKIKGSKLYNYEWNNIAADVNYLIGLNIEDISGTFEADWIIRCNGIYYEALKCGEKEITYGGENDAGGISGEVVNTVLQAVSNAEGACDIHIKSGIFKYNNHVHLKAYQRVKGSWATIFQPLGDVSLFELVAPLTRITLTDFQIWDDAGLSFKSAILLDNANEIISLSLFENIHTWNLYSVIETTAEASNIAKSILSCTFRTLTANNYRSRAFVFKSQFDCRYDDLFASQKNHDSMDGIIFEKSEESGSMFGSLTCLGKNEFIEGQWHNNMGSGITFYDVSNMYGGKLIADTMREGLHLADRADKIWISTVEVRSSTDQGIYANHNSGLVVIHGITMQDCHKFGVRNMEQGGYIYLYGGQMQNCNIDGGGDPQYLLHLGDQLHFIMGVFDYGQFDGNAIPWGYVPASGLIIGGDCPIWSDDPEIIKLKYIHPVGGYKSCDGTAGKWEDVEVAKVGGGTRTLKFRDGIYIGYADS